MNKWKDYKIGEVADVIGGGTPSTSKSEFWNGNIPWLTPRDLTNYTRMYISKGERCITGLGLQKSSSKLLPKGTVLLTSRAPIGYVAIAENELCTNQGFKSIVTKSDKLDNQYLYYWLKNNTDYLQGLGSGTTFAEISGSVVKGIDLSLPPLPLQKTIASILSSLDNKIDLLYRQNQTLETMAETLFKEWFLENKNNKLMHYGDLVNSVSVKHCFDREKIVFLNTSDIYNGHVLVHEHSDVAGLPGQARKSIKKGDILFTEIRPANRRFAYINFDANDYVVSTKLMVLRSKGLLSDSILYLYLKWLPNLEYLQMLAESRSGTFPQITFDDLKTVEINIPPQETLDNLTPIFDNILSKTFSNYDQIQTLTKLRDTLLPKLMSGEVRVKT